MGGLNQFGNYGFKGNTSIPGSFPGGPNASESQSMNGFPAGNPPNGGNMPPGSPPQGIRSGVNSGGMQGMNDRGEPGLFRMGDAGMSGQISWMLPFALIGLLAWLCRPTRQILMKLNERAIVTIALLL
jgi:hypothetical protein